MTRIKANLTILRPSRGGDDAVIYIAVKDEASRARFLELEISPADFAMALTGLSEVECSALVRQLDVVGMRKIVERRSIAYPHKWNYERAELEDWLKENAKEPGWIVDASLRSQSSVSRFDDKYTLNYNVYRYEPINEPEGGAA